MKTQMLRILLVTLFTVPLLALGQSPIEKLYQKYAGEDCFTTVNISSEMFSMFSNIETSGNDEEFKDFQEMVKGIDGLKILSYEPDGDCKKVDFLADIKKLYDLDSYSELMVVKEKNEEVKFLVKKDNGNISELLMIAVESDEITLLSMTGILDMKYISKLSKTMHLDGMDNLQKIDEDRDEDSDED